MKKLRKITALLLAVILAVSVFAGCSKEKEATGDEYVYVPNYMDFPFDIQYIDRARVVGDTVYILASVIDGKETDTWVDENGEEHTEEYDRTVSKIFTMKTDGSDPKELPGYVFANENIEDQWTNVWDFIVDKDGKINVIKYTERYIFDLPAGFDPETDNKWEYQTGSATEICSEVLAEDGTVTETRKIYSSENGNGMGSILCGEDGNWYISDYQNLIVADPEGNELYRIEDAYADSFMSLPDGRIGAVTWGESGMEIKVFDNSKREFGEAIPLPDDCYNVVGANEKYEIIYNQYTSLYGYDIDTQQKEKILDWLDADIDAGNLSTVAVLENGDVFCLISSWDDNGSSIDAVKLERKKASEVVEKKVITMAAMYLDWNVRQMVLEYNKTNPEYRIKVTVYNDYNTDEDRTLGMTKLNTEMISGKVPDIICCSADLPITRYAAKGLLEDLTPYIENSVGMDNLVEPFCSALKDSEGRLYEIYPNFFLTTTVGLSRIVGDGSSWTFEDVAAAMEKLPEGAEVFEPYYTKSDALYTCIARNIGSFVDWETGECRFDSEEFIDLLKFANTFKDSVDDEDYNYRNPCERVLSGKQLLYNVGLYNLDDFRAETFYTFGKDISFVGFPTLSGSGSSFSINSTGFAMSSQCQYKDAVWDFIGQLLTEEYQSENDYWWGLPTNKTVFDKMVEESMTPTFSEYAQEEIENMNGGIVYAEDSADEPADAAGEENAEEQGPSVTFNEGQVNEQGWHEEPKTWSWNSDTSVPVFAMTEYEYNAIMDLINNTTAVARYDESIMSVINEEVQAYFQGQKSAEDTAKMIQSRVKLYVNEQK